MGSDELKAVIRRLHWGDKRGIPEHNAIDVTPGCAFGAVVDQRLKDMERRFGELRARLDGLIFLVIGAVVVEVIMRLVG
ncbi:MAG: hypothetical protein HY664_00045 [Chloroflexi bacterium]|nr:hypothetical protein [Chloroflexota bacterium]